MYTKIILTTCLSLILACKASSQIEGGVTDQQEKPLANVTLTATDSSGRVVETIQSSDRGFYEFNGLKKGRYKIEAKIPGYHATLENIMVYREATSSSERKKDISSATRLDIILAPDK